MKVTSMKYEKFNIKFFVSFWNWLVFLSQMYVTWSNKKALLLFLVSGLDNSCKRKNSFKFHGRYVTSMSTVLVVTDFSEKMEVEKYWRLLHSLLEEYESFSSRLLWVPPSVSNGGSALCPDDFWNFSPYAFWLCTYIPRVVYFKKCHFLFFLCGMDQLRL